MRRSSILVLSLWCLISSTTVLPALSGIPRGVQGPALSGPQATTPATPRQTLTQAPPALVTVLPRAKDSVKFLVMGDSGTGGKAQYALSERMSEAHARFPFEFAIMLGDNLYGGENARDYYDKFEKPYKKLLDAGVKFYASLGNHDEPAQRFYKGFNMDGKRYYKYSKGGVDFFVLDSTYITPQQVEWLKDELRRSDAKWKISYFHHPIYSSGERHGSEMDLRARIEPLFQEHGVDVVFSGHEHFYERLRPQKGIYYITQGAAGKLRRGNIALGSQMTAKGFDSDYSFTLIEIEGDQMFFETISLRGRVVDAGIIPRRETAQTLTQ